MILLKLELEMLPNRNYVWTICVLIAGCWLTHFYCGDLYWAVNALLGTVGIKNDLTEGKVTLQL